MLHRIAKNLLKRKVSEDNIVEKPSKFILTEIKNFNTENNLNATDLNYIRRNLTMEQVMYPIVISN
ncbi:hypothetical protein QTP88_005881 [Uroleucon formosanum]